MKIGILTFHYGYNYGGVLQAYALQESLKVEGYEVYIINYIPNSYKINTLYGLSKRNPYGSVKKLLGNLLYQRKSKIQFDEFRKKYLNTTDLIHSIEELESVCSNFNAIIVGSDQIWNPWQHDKRIYFLDFILNDTIKRISYAPCCTVNNVSEENKESLKFSLNRFNSISVRNFETRNFIYDLLQLDSPVVLDPTFLWDFSELINIGFQKEKYILTYILGKDLNDNNANAIKRIKQLNGDIPVYALVIGAIAGVITIPWADKVIYNASPIEWLNYIKNASFFYTDSFHGVVFALKFKIKFLAYYSEYLRSYRFIDIKKTYKLDKFIITNFDQINIVSDEEFNIKIDEIFEINKKKIIESKAFLHKSINT